MGDFSISRRDSRHSTRIKCGYIKNIWKQASDKSRYKLSDESCVRIFDKVMLPNIVLSRIDEHKPQTTHESDASLTRSCPSRIVLKILRTDNKYKNLSVTPNKISHVTFRKERVKVHRHRARAADMYYEPHSSTDLSSKRDISSVMEHKCNKDISLQRDTKACSKPITVEQTPVHKIMTDSARIKYPKSHWMLSRKLVRISFQHKTKKCFREDRQCRKERIHHSPGCKAFVIHPVQGNGIKLHLSRSDNIQSVGKLNQRGAMPDGQGITTQNDLGIEQTPAAVSINNMTDQRSDEPLNNCSSQSQRTTNNDTIPEIIVYRPITIGLPQDCESALDKPSFLASQHLNTDSLMSFTENHDPSDSDKTVHTGTARISDENRGLQEVHQRRTQHQNSVIEQENESGDSRSSNDDITLEDITKCLTIMSPGKTSAENPSDMILFIKNVPSGIESSIIDIPEICCSSTNTKTVSPLAVSTNSPIDKMAISRASVVSGEGPSTGYPDSRLRPKTDIWHPDENQSHHWDSKSFPTEADIVDLTLEPTEPSNPEPNKPHPITYTGAATELFPKCQGSAVSNMSTKVPAFETVEKENDFEMKTEVNQLVLAKSTNDIFQCNQPFSVHGRMYSSSVKSSYSGKGTGCDVQSCLPTPPDSPGERLHGARCSIAENTVAKCASFVGQEKFTQGCRKQNDRQVDSSNPLMQKEHIQHMTENLYADGINGHMSREYQRRHKHYQKWGQVPLLNSHGKVKRKRGRPPSARTTFQRNPIHTSYFNIPHYGSPQAKSITNKPPVQCFNPVVPFPDTQSKVFPTSVVEPASLSCERRTHQAHSASLMHCPVHMKAREYQNNTLVDNAECLPYYHMLFRNRSTNPPSEMIQQRPHKPPNYLQHCSGKVSKTDYTQNTGSLTNSDSLHIFNGNRNQLECFQRPMMMAHNVAQGGEMCSPFRPTANSRLCENAYSLENHKIHFEQQNGSRQTFGCNPDLAQCFSGPSTQPVTFGPISRKSVTVEKPLHHLHGTSTMTQSVNLSPQTLSPLSQPSNFRQYQTASLQGKQQAVPPNWMMAMKCLGCDGPARFLCKGCRRTVYCSPRCQLTTWAEHSKICNHDNDKVQDSQQLIYQHSSGR